MRDPPQPGSELGCRCGCDLVALRSAAVLHCGWLRIFGLGENPPKEHANRRSAPAADVEAAQHRSSHRKQPHSHAELWLQGLISPLNLGAMPTDRHPEDAEHAFQTLKLPGMESPRRKSLR